MMMSRCLLWCCIGGSGGVVIGGGVMIVGSLMTLFVMSVWLCCVGWSLTVILFELMCWTAVLCVMLSMVVSMILR